MNFELWLAFVAAYTVISLIPGPSVLLVTGIALSRGGKAACLCIVGELVGGVALIGLSLFGVGAILAASSGLFQIVKSMGVFYMAYLGLRQIMETRRDHTDRHDRSLKHDGISSVRAGFFYGRSESQGDSVLCGFRFSVSRPSRQHLFAVRHRGRHFNRDRRCRAWGICDDRRPSAQNVSKRPGAATVRLCGWRRTDRRERVHGRDALISNRFCLLRHNDIGAFLSDHDGGRVRVARCDRRHDRRIDNP